MKFKFKNVAALFVSIIMFNSIIVHANVLPKKEQITVEILYNANGEDFADNIVFDDGSKLSDYNYTDKYTPAPKSLSQIEEYFNYAACVTRDGITSLSLDPKPSVRSNSTTRNQA